MRVKGEIEIGCPNCGASNRVLVWDTINAQLGEEAKSALLCGETNVFCCQRCQRTFNVETSLLYNDVENKFMLYYFPFALVRNGKIFDAITPGGPVKSRRYFPEAGYAGSIQYVFEMDGLVRYIQSRDALAEKMRHAPG